MIREIEETDRQNILEIYKMGIANRQATFETETPSWSTWKQKFFCHSRYVYLHEDKVVGWIALSPVSERAVYRGVAEVSVYIHNGYQGIGIGSKLLKRAIKSSEEHGIWTLQSSVFPENTATVRLHLNHGFRIVGEREQIAKLDGDWRNTLLLERRSEAFTG